MEAEVLETPTVAVSRHPWPRIVRSYGSLVADEIAVIGSRVEGRVDQVHVDLGDAVTAGTPIVTLRQNEFRMRVEHSEAQLLQARAAVGLAAGDPAEQLSPENAPPVLEQKAVWTEALAAVERAKQLVVRNSISAAEFEQLTATAAVSDARYRSALNGAREKIALISVREAELSLVREALTDTVICAPFASQIQQKQVSPGTYVRIGDAVATVVRTNPLRFRGSVPERHALSLAVGQQVQLQIESVAAPVDVEVTRISPAVDLQSRSLVFEAVVDNHDGDYRSGLFAEARVVTDPQAQAIVIPASSLIEFAGVEKVWKVVDGEALEQQVLTGERRDSGIAVLEGVIEGDVILLDATAGRRARVVPLAVTTTGAARPDVTEQAVAGAMSGTSAENPPLTASPGGPKSPANSSPAR